MNDEKRLIPKPSIYDAIKGYSEQTPAGTWHMYQFVEALNNEKDVPAETMEFLRNSFENILKELRESKGNGMSNRDRIPAKHLPVTSPKRKKTSPAEGMTCEQIDKNRPRLQTMLVLKLMELRNIKKTKAIEETAKAFDVTVDTVRGSFNKWEECAIQDHNAMKRAGVFHVYEDD